MDIVHPSQDLGNQNHEEGATQDILADGREGLTEQIDDRSENEALPVRKGMPDDIAIPLEQPCNEGHAKKESEELYAGRCS